MGFFKLSKQQKERRAFRGLVSKKTTQAARQAYAEEAEKVAIERAKAKARRPSIGQVLAERVSGSVRRTASGTKTRRKTIKSTPIKRSKPLKQRQPKNLNEALYGY